MKVINDKKLIVFENDDEFYNWVIVPKLNTIQCGSIIYTDVDYTYDYLDKVRRGFMFVIKDKKSTIIKHQAVSYRTITKKVQNLKPYYGR